jgi:hypothetical protein
MINWPARPLTLSLWPWCLDHSSMNLFPWSCCLDFVVLTLFPWSCCLDFVVLTLFPWSCCLDFGVLTVLTCLTCCSDLVPLTLFLWLYCPDTVPQTLLPWLCFSKISFETSPDLSFLILFSPCSLNLVNCPRFTDLVPSTLSPCPCFLTIILRLWSHDLQCFPDLVPQTLFLWPFFPSLVPLAMFTWSCFPDLVVPILKVPLPMFLCSWIFLWPWPCRSDLP